MAKYVYTGPPELRGVVPSWGFDDGVLADDHLKALMARGHVREIATLAAASDQPGADDSGTVEDLLDLAPAEKPLSKMNKRELAEVAESLGLDPTGTNREIADRIAAARAG